MPVPSFAAIAGATRVLAADLIRDGLQAQPGSPSRRRAATVVDPDLARSLRVASARWAAARTAPTMTERRGSEIGDELDASFLEIAGESALARFAPIHRPASVLSTAVSTAEGEALGLLRPGMSPRCRSAPREGSVLARPLGERSCDGVGKPGGEMVVVGAGVYSPCPTPMRRFRWTAMPRDGEQVAEVRPAGRGRRNGDAHRDASIAPGERRNVLGVNRTRSELGITEPVLGGAGLRLFPPACAIDAVLLRLAGRKRDPLQPLARQLGCRHPRQLHSAFLDFHPPARELAQHGANSHDHARVRDDHPGAATQRPRRG
jgi:hypothetical protein